MASVGNSIKICSRCSKPKYLTGFSKTSLIYYKDGYYNICKVCRSNARRRKARVILAGRAVQRAISQGKLLPAKDCDCYHCGKQEAEYHHYNGYERKHWYDVVPLCRACHSEEHVLLKKGVKKGKGDF